MISQFGRTMDACSNSIFSSSPEKLFLCTVYSPTIWGLFCYSFTTLVEYLLFFHACLTIKSALFLIHFCMNDARFMNVLQVNSCRDALSTTENWPEKKRGEKKTSVQPMDNCFWYTMHNGWIERMIHVHEYCFFCAPQFKCFLKSKKSALTLH